MIAVSARRYEGIPASLGNENQRSKLFLRYELCQVGEYLSVLLLRVEYVSQRVTSKGEPQDRYA